MTPWFHDKRQLLTNSANLSTISLNSGTTEIPACTSRPNCGWCELPPALSRHHLLAPTSLLTPFLEAGEGAGTLPSPSRVGWQLAVRSRHERAALPQAWALLHTGLLWADWADWAAVGSRCWWPSQVSLCWGHLLLSPGRTTRDPRVIWKGNNIRRC